MKKYFDPAIEKPEDPSHMMKRIKFLWLAVLLLLSAASVANGQGASVKSTKLSNARVYFDQGVAHHKAGRFKEATEAFRQAIKLEPRDAETHYYLGDSYFSLELYKESIKSYRQAIKLRPNYSAAHNNLGMAYLRAGQYKEAVKSFDETLRLEPDYSLAHYNLGAAYLERGDRSAALERVMILRMIDPKRAKKLNGLLTESGKPVSSVVFNAKTVALPEPEYSRAAKLAKASGAVVVIATIDEAGKVISAHAIRGHPLLREASVKAALKSRFTPTMVSGRAVKVTGVFTYDFKSDEKTQPKLPSHVMHF